jgi:hypothetical protein
MIASIPSDVLVTQARSSAELDAARWRLGSTSSAARRDGWTRWASSIGARPTWTTRGHTAAVRGSFSALLGAEDDLDGRGALNQRVAAAGDHGVVVDSVTVSVLL